MRWAQCVRVRVAVRWIAIFLTTVLSFIVSTLTTGAFSA